MPNLIHHEQQPEVFALSVHVFTDISRQLGNAKLVRLLAVEPVPRGLFAHTKHRLKHFDHVIFKKGKGIAGFQPRCTIHLFKGLAKCLRFALFFNEAFQLRNFQIIAIKAAVIVKHLRENAQNSGFILCNRTLYVDIKQDGFCRSCTAPRRSRFHHRVVKFIGKVIHHPPAAYLLVGKQV